MIAYSETFLRQLAFVKKAKNWLNQNYISKSQYEELVKTIQLGRTSASIFVKIGLFIFTVFTILASVGLFALFFLSSGGFDGIILISSFLFAAICIFILETNIASNRWYNNGIDNALLYASIMFIICGLFMNSNFSFFNSEKSTIMLFVLLPIVVIAAIRYVDRFLAVVAMYSAFTLLTTLFINLNWPPIIYSILLMVVAAAAYLFFYRMKNRGQDTVFFGIYETNRLVSALLFYLFGNYHLIRTSTFEWQYRHEGQIGTVPMAWFFYLFTAAVPLIFIFISLKQKDKPLLWLALLILAASAITFKVYFSLGHPEMALTIVGILLMVIAYLSINYLKGVKHGLSADKEDLNDNIMKSHIEAFILNESFSKTNIPTQNQTEMGGGTFGGAGSGNQY